MNTSSSVEKPLVDPTKTKSVSSWMQDFLKTEDKRETRLEAFVDLVGNTKHEDGTFGSIDNIPKSVMTDLRSATQSHYVALHPKSTVAVLTEGEGDATSRKAWVVGKGYTAAAPEGSKGTLETFVLNTADTLSADLKDTPPSKKAAMVKVRAMASNYVGITVDRTVSAAKRRAADVAKTKAESLGENVNEAGSSKKTRDFKTFAIESLSALHKRASKGRGKDATVPDGWDAKIAAANAAWHKAVFGS
jgi:hypothetical protein